MTIRSISAALAVATSTLACAAALAQTDAATTSTAVTTDGAAAASSTSTTLGPSPAGTENVSISSLKEAEAPVTPRRVKGELYIEQHNPKSNLNNRGGIGTSINRFGLYYKNSDNESLELHQYFEANGQQTQADGTKTPGDVYRMQDLSVQYTNSKLATIFGDGSIIAISRLYFPTGENSRFTTQRQGAARQYLIATKSVGKFDYNYVVVGDYYNWTKDQYIDHDGSRKQNNEWYLAHEFDVNYNFTKWFALDQEIGTETLRKRPMPGKVDYMENLNILTTATFTVTPDINLQAVLENDINIYNNSDKGFKVWRDDELEAILILNAKL